MKTLPEYITSEQADDIAGQIVDRKLDVQCVASAIKYLEKTGTHTHPHITFHDYVSGWSAALQHQNEFTSEIQYINQTKRRK